MEGKTYGIYEQRKRWPEQYMYYELYIVGGNTREQEIIIQREL